MFIRPRNLRRSREGGNECYLEGQGDLVTRLMMGIIGVTIWVIGVYNLLTKPP